MRTIKDLIGIEKERKALIIGAGATIKSHKTLIDNYIGKHNPIVMGINNMTALWIPEYHLWTNTQRLRTYGANIKEDSKLLLGQNIPLKIIRNVIGEREYTLINYTDTAALPIDYHDGKIYGYYRTAGCLAIMILYLMGVSEINIVGMDGYTLHAYDDLVAGKQFQHCYGNETGYTDTANWETCLKKDDIINGVLYTLRDYGVRFKILTPTKYEEFYDKQCLR